MPDRVCGILGHVTERRDWLLTRPERGNPSTRLDDRHEGDDAWSEGNLVTPLVHGAAYFRDLYDALTATREGDLVLFTDWQGDADERLTDEPGSRGGRGPRDRRRARGRRAWPGVALAPGPDRVLRHREPAPRRAAPAPRRRGAPRHARPRRGSHHQKFVVIRHRDDPSRDVAFVGGIDLAHNRRDDADHHGDPQPQPLTDEYGPNPPWHDLQVRIQGPAVHDVETVFRERWEDPTPLSRSPLRRLSDRLRRLDVSPDPLPAQQPPPPEAGTHTVQLLRTYPTCGTVGTSRSPGAASAASPGATPRRSAGRAAWSTSRTSTSGVMTSPTRSSAALREPTELRLVVVIPLVPDVDGLARIPELLGRNRAFPP